MSQIKSRGSTYYESLSVITQNKCYYELYQERIIDSYSILRESVVTKPNIKFSGTLTETLVLTLMYSKS